MASVAGCRSLHPSQMVTKMEWRGIYHIDNDESRRMVQQILDGRCYLVLSWR